MKTDFWKYIEILRQPDKVRFFSKGNLEDKINALLKIADEGYPSLIYSLTSFLRDKNQKIREATCRTIIHLFKKIESKKNYYGTLRHCVISNSDIDFYAANFPTDQYIELLAISSFNSDGHIREKAVKRLSQVAHPRAIQFLIYRLADWVKPVRESALNGIENYKSVTYVDSLIENLPIFEWLQKVKRTDLNKIYSDIIEFIISTNRKYVLANFKKYPDKLRFIISKHISNLLVDVPTELELFLKDRHPLIRSLIIDHFEKLNQNEINQLLNDKSGKIRLQALYHLEGTKEFKSIVQNYLADNSATVRYFARFTLKEAGIDFSIFYNQKLQENNQLIGSLKGLAEVDAKQFSESVKQYLDSNKIKIRKTAFEALRRLDENSAYEFALATLDSPYIGLRNKIIDFLGTTPTQEVLMKAREVYKGGNYELKKSMLKLFNKIGNWATISDLMIGTIDENEFIRNLGKQYVEQWKIKATNLYSTPQKDDLNRARQVFNLAYEMLEDKQYFITNPLEGLDFYFK